MSHGKAGSLPDFAKFVWTIVVAGGSGLRFGSRKQFADLGGRSVVQRSVDVAFSVSAGVVVVLPADAVASTELIGGGGELRLVAGGASRAESVRAGLEALPDTAEVVLVHDAARPLASTSLFERVIQAVRDGAAGVVPAVAVADTIRRKGGGVVDRSDLLAVQTPQGFDVATLREAHASNLDATDDATLVEALGHGVAIVEGEAQNDKLTEPSDLISAVSIINAQNEGHVTESNQSNTPLEVPAMRVGQGFDIHPFSSDPARPMVLGGVTFPDDSPGLAGHSDADVIAHAVTDAILGAAGLGDIGSHFPDTDPALAGADSIELLRSAAASIRNAGWTPLNADCSVVLDAPKLAPRREEMQERLSDALGAPVTVKGKRPEGIGSLGRHEGIACWATALVSKLGDLASDVAGDA